jgi:hypothetical protein
MAERCSAQAASHASAASGSPGRLLGSDSGHDEWRQESPLARRTRPLECVATVPCRLVGTVGEESGLREAPERREDEIDRAAVQSNRECGPQLHLRCVVVSPAESHKPDRPTCHRCRPPAAAVGDCLAARGGSVVPVPARPRDQPGQRAHHVTAVRLLDSVGIEHPVGEKPARTSVVHGPDGERGGVAEGGDPGALEAGKSGFVGGRRDTVEAARNPTLEHVDHGLERVRLDSRDDISERSPRLAHRRDRGPRRLDLGSIQVDSSPFVQQVGAGHLALIVGRESCEFLGQGGCER